MHYSVSWGSFLIVNVPNQCKVRFLFYVQKTRYYEIVVVNELFTNVQIMIFILPDVKKRVSVKNYDKISVIWIFLDQIKNRVSVKSVYVEAVYLEALLYLH